MPEAASPAGPAAGVRLVLASASPARRATLRSAGIEPEVRVSGVDEPAVVAAAGIERPDDVALLLARAKAEDVARTLTADGTGPDALVLGCDSVLDFEGDVLGKPADADQARERWRRMRGRSGRLVTGHWLIDARGGGTGRATGAVAGTVVHFAEPDDEELDAYLATGEPLAVAGAFTVDGLGGAFVRGIEGDHHNVVGVSLPLVRTLARDLGVRWPALWSARA